MSEIERNMGISEPEDQKKELSAHDLIRYFVAGQLYGNPEIKSGEIRKNIAREFQIAEEHVLVFGEWPHLNVWPHPEVSEDLQQRFGGASIPHISDEEAMEDFRKSQVWDNY